MALICLGTKIRDARIAIATENSTLSAIKLRLHDRIIAANQLPELLVT